MNQFRFRSCFVAFCVIVLSSTHSFASKKAEHVWLTGKILDENQASHYIGTYHNSSTNASANGSWTDNGYGGSYSGNGHSSTSSMSMPLYHVYENLVVEGDGMIFITSERLRWRWSKGAHVTVNDSIQYYVNGRKLHILDQDGKEHSIQINKAIRKDVTETKASEKSMTDANTAVAVQVDSTPVGADIEVDGAFVGNTPSTVSISAGEHEITVRKKGFTVWTRKLTANGGAIHVAAELEAQTPVASSTATQAKLPSPAQAPQ